MRFSRTALLLVAGLAAAPLPAALAAEATRLEAAFITREPRLPPPNRPDAPLEEGWPEPGRPVQWVAHLFNRSDAPAAGVPYAWSIDGAEVESGTVDLPPGETTLWLSWRWTFERHEVALQITPPVALHDSTSADDRVAIASDALSVGFWMEKSVYDWMLQDGRPGFERWAQGQIEKWNALLARARYPSLPQGPRDRLRLDRILVLPDGVPIRNGDMDTDVMWGFVAANNDERFLHVGAPPSVLADSTIVLHELLHLRGLIDLYAYAVVSGDVDRTASVVGILENGRPVVGTPAMPSLANLLSGFLVYRTPVDGLMGSQYRAGASLDEHSAWGLELRAGRRTPLWLDQWGNQINGFSNQPQPDSYVRRLPRRTLLRLVDAGGTPIAGATVQVFVDHSGFTYQKLYGAQPDFTFSTDGSGVFALPGDVLDHQPSAAAPPKAQVIIVGVQTAGAHGYAFLPVYDLNLLAFRGSPDVAQKDLTVRLLPR